MSLQLCNYVNYFKANIHIFSPAQQASAGLQSDIHAHIWRTNICTNAVLLRLHESIRTAYHIIYAKIAGVLIILNIFASLFPDLTFVTNSMYNFPRICVMI